MMRPLLALGITSLLLLAGCSGGAEETRTEPFKPTPMPDSVKADHERLLRERSAPPTGPTGAPTGAPTNGP